MTLLETGLPTVPLGRAVKINADVLPESTTPESEFRYVDIATVGRGYLKEEPQALSFEQAPSRARRILRPGDILVSTVRTYLRSVMRIPEGETGLIGSTGFAVLTAPSDLTSRYLGWYVQSEPFIEDVVARSVGVSYPAISPSELARMPVPSPDPPAQRAIADFLDTETARIDALIDKKRRLADVVQERSQHRLSMLARTGTDRGQTKDTGHDWLGAIPSHWEIARLVFEARLESGHTPSRTRPELWKNCDTPWVTLNDVGYLSGVEFVEKTTNLISAEGLAASSARVLPKGTVILSRDATIGRTGTLAEPMATSQHFVNWICGERLHPRYLWLLFRTLMQNHFDSLTDGATLRTIGMPDVRNFAIPLPPIKEQVEIVGEAEKERRFAGQIASNLDRQLGLLEERRRTLITAAVTGEMEVPGVAVA